MKKICCNSIINELFTKYPLTDKMKPYEIIGKYYDRYKSEYVPNNSLNGSIFEYLLLIVFLREGITPIYYQAKLTFVPNIDFDILFYNRKTPVSVSAKTSLRERWKQADIEAMAMKYVHRKAQCYVLTLSEKEVITRRKEDNSYVGIDEFIIANKPEFDDWLEKIKKINFKESEQIEIVENASNSKMDSAKLNSLLGFKSLV